MRLRELSYIPTEDATVEFLDYKDPDAIKIYESTLRYVVAMAVKNLYPSAKVRFNYSISRSILAVFDQFNGILNQSTLDDIEKEVNDLIKKRSTYCKKKNLFRRSNETLWWTWYAW